MQELAHLEWIKNHYVHQIEQKLVQMDIEESNEQILNRIIEADPTDKKILVEWILKTWLEDGMLIEDFASGTTSKAYKTLSSFREHFKKLDRLDRDLSSYPRLSSVFAKIEPFLAPVEIDSSKSGKQKKREEREQALAQSSVLLRSEEMIVAVPLTEEAAQWWGRGTQWCTAATESENYFHYYDKKAPLIVVVFPKLGTKIQLHVEGNTIQFNDEQDEPLTNDFVGKHWNLLEPIVFWMYEKTPRAIKHIPFHLRNSELFHEALKRYEEANNSTQISNLIYDCRYTEMPADICFQAIQQDATLISYLSDKNRTNEIAYLAVRKDGRLLRFVPSSVKTPELCLEAVEQNGLAMEWVPDEWRNDMCETAIRSNALALEFVPEEFCTQKIYMNAFQQNPWTLQWFPSDLVDEQLLQQAFSRDGMVLKLFKNKVENKELALVAFEQTAQAFAYINKKWQDGELCQLAVEKHPDNIQYVDEKFKTFDLYKTAYYAAPATSKWMPWEVVDELKILYRKDFPEKFKEEQTVQPTTSESEPKKSVSRAWDYSEIEVLGNKLAGYFNITNQENGSALGMH